ncbi:MAG TPA: hypothetical protein VN802_06645 [Stellaceae bacterium]|nr:hypothetical protein [Stellaceae bacterium]
MELNAMLEWLDERAGRGSHRSGSQMRPGAALLYVVDVESARAFVERFDGGIVLLSGRESERPE